MSDFDTALRARLERLDAAVPAFADPVVPATRTWRPGRRRRQVILLVAATALLALGSAVVTLGSPPPLTPEQLARNLALEERVGAALLPDFPDEECFDRHEATRRVRARLDALGLSSWQIREDAAAANARCTTFGVSASMEAVIVMGRIDPTVRIAMEGLVDRFLERCLNRAEATQLVAATMAEIGFTEFAVSADPWGPKGSPIDKWGAYQRHIANGCFVYVSTQIARDGSGRLVVYLWGPWP